MTTPAVDPDKQPLPARKAGLLQIAKTMFFVLIMIGKKKTWEEGGEAAGMTPAQVVAGAVIAGVAVIAILIGLVKIVLA